MISSEKALQDVWPNATCYGCGPANQHGLHIKSYWMGEEAVCTFHPQPYHNAGFDNVMYGGLVASLCDCHSVWAAIAATYQREGREHGTAPAISYVTGNLNVSFLAPTKLDQPVVLRARIEELGTQKVVIVCDVYSGETKTVEARVVAVRIAADKSVGSAESA